MPDPKSELANLRKRKLQLEADVQGHQHQLDRAQAKLDQCKAKIAVFEEQLATLTTE